MGGPDEPKASDLMELTGEVAKITDLPVIADQNGATGGGMAFPVGATVRLVVFGIAGVLLMWHLQRRRNRQAGIVRAPQKGPGKRAEAA
jgi:hypothetical protein